jgi:hypothetical protein
MIVYQDRLGTNIGTENSKKDAFLQAQPTQEQQEYLNALPLQDQVRKRIF